MKIKKKHRDLCEGIVPFVDKRWFPGYEVRDEDIRAFVRYESEGESRMEEEEKAAAEALVNGKTNKVWTVAMVWGEMMEWWESGNGWIYPLEHAIESAGGTQWRAELEGIKAKCFKEGFGVCLSKFTGIGDERKAIAFDRFYGNSGCKAVAS
jgi:hypothetical protein